MPRASLASIPLCLNARSSNVGILVLLPLVQLYASTRRSKAIISCFYHISIKILAVGRVTPTPRTASARTPHRFDIPSIVPTKRSAGKRSILMNIAVRGLPYDQLPQIGGGWQRRRVRCGAELTLDVCCVDWERGRKGPS